MEKKVEFCTEKEEPNKCSNIMTEKIEVRLERSIVTFGILDKTDVMTWAYDVFAYERLPEFPYLKQFAWCARHSAIRRQKMKTELVINLRMIIPSCELL